MDTINRPAWRGLAQVQTGSKIRQVLRLAARYIAAYPVLVWRFLRHPPPDAVVVGYLGMFDVFVIWPFAWLRGVPFYWDVFISLYNTVVEDRRLLREKSIAARALYLCEYIALRLPARVFMDTEAHAAYLRDRFALHRHRVFSVPVGVETQVFHRQAGNGPSDDRLNVLFYGTLIPLHGLEVILDAVMRTRDLPIHWKLVGRGQEAHRIERVMADAAPENLEWIPWVEYGQLIDEIHAADVCLGIFGTTEKAARVVPNKVYQIIACGKPLVTMDSPAIHELLEQQQPGVWLVPPGDPDKLAAVLRDLYDRRAALRAGQYHTNLDGLISPRSVSLRLLAVLEEDTA